MKRIAVVCVTFLSLWRPLCFALPAPDCILVAEDPHYNSFFLPLNTTHNGRPVWQMIDSTNGRIVAKDRFLFFPNLGNFWNIGPLTDSTHERTSYVDGGSDPTCPDDGLPIYTWENGHQARSGTLLRVAAPIYTGCVPTPGKPLGVNRLAGTTSSLKDCAVSVAGTFLESVAASYDVKTKECRAVLYDFSWNSTDPTGLSCAFECNPLQGRGVGGGKASVAARFPLPLKEEDPSLNRLQLCAQHVKQQFPNANGASASDSDCIALEMAKTDLDEQWLSCFVGPWLPPPPTTTTSTTTTTTTVTTTPSMV